MLYKRFSKNKKSTILLPILIPVMNLFLVLLPFVLETSLLQQLTTHEITLPSLKSSSSTSANVKKDVVLSVMKDYVMIDYENNSWRINLDDQFNKKLENELIKIRNSNPEIKSIQLKVDNNVTYQFLIDVIDICKRSNVGFEEIVYIDEVN
ncbi:MAG: biopolymer transporter ExbD [Proteobacteria bacterium]|nr:biopolymer transporter ExbD [Pseudomonadota bacterium]